MNREDQQEPKPAPGSGRDQEGRPDPTQAVRANSKGRPEGMSRDLVGKTYTYDRPVTAMEEEMIAFARATNDENPLYVDPSRPGGVVAPPLFLVRPFRDLYFQVILDPDLGADVLMLLHGEQEMVFHGPVRPGDELSMDGRITEIQSRTGGEIVSVACDARRDGELVAESISGFFVRSRSKAGSKRQSKPQEKLMADGGGSEPPPLAFEERMEVTADQSLRYAEAGLDNNPIHTDPEVARAAGFPGPILQGLCTMAFASRAFVQRVGGGDPSRLKRLKVRFARPVLNDSTLTTRAHLVGEGEGAASSPWCSA